MTSMLLSSTTICSFQAMNKSAGVRLLLRKM